MSANPAPSAVNVNHSMLARRRRYATGTFLAVFAVVFLFELVSTFSSARLYQAEAMVKVSLSPMDDYSDEGSNEATVVAVLRSDMLINLVEQRLTDSDRHALMGMVPPGHAPASRLTLIGNVLAENREVRVRPQPHHELAPLLSIQFRHPDRVIAAKVANLFAEEYIAYMAHNYAADLAHATSALQSRIDEQRRKVNEITDVLQTDEKIMILAQSSASTTELGRLTAEHQSRQRELETVQNYIQEVSQRLAEIMASSPRGPDGSLPPVIEAAAISPAEGDYASPSIPSQLGLGFLLALGCGLAAAGTVWLAGRLFAGH